MQKLLLVFAAVLSLVALGQSDDVCKYRQDIVNGSTCAIVNATISIGYTYKNEEDKEVKGTYHVPCHPTPVQGDSCSSPAGMTFNFEDMSISFYFGTKADNKWNLERVSVLVTDTQEFFNATFDEGPDYMAGNTTGGDIIKDNVKNKQSYMCDAETTYSMSSNFSNVTWSITFKNFRVQAFDFDGGNNPEFGSASRCNADIKGSKIVPIAVGAALAGLVIIVLIAYIIGRIRSRKQSSYEALS